MLKPSLQLRIGQQLTMTPQLQQAIRLLQLPSLDLQAHVRETLETNVMLEAEDELAPDTPPDTVRERWSLHARLVRRSLERGFYQGWDLHPAQLVTRHAAVTAFFLEGREEAAGRLQLFVERAAQATLLGNVFDDAATGQGLLNFFLRGISCGALSEDEVLATGITLEELRGRSFVKILKNRSGG